jgi:hypothetical protein
MYKVIMRPQQDVSCIVGVTRGMQGQGGRGANAPPIFFLPKDKVLATELKRGK